MQANECVLCGARFDVTPSLVEWSDPVFPDRRWENVARCRAVAGCRERVEAAGKVWPLVHRGELRDRLALQEAR